MLRVFPHRLPFTVVLTLVTTLWFSLAAEESQAPSAHDAAKAKLATLQYLVGGWKGVGQPQRGSTKDNWTEQAEWAWDFSGKMPALVGKFKEARFFKQLRVSTTGKDQAAFQLTAISAQGEEISLPGKTEEEGKLVFTAEKTNDAIPSRVTLRTVANGDRLLVLYERPAATAGNWQRLGEVGATRVGSDFGKGSNGPECVVTGGLGTMTVTHEGKTYYVCCTGCRDLFNERPAEVLAEYRAKKEAEAKKKGMK